MSGKNEITDIDLTISFEGYSQDIPMECHYTFDKGSPMYEDSPEESPRVNLQAAWIRYDKRNRVDILKLLTDDMVYAIESDLRETELLLRNI